MQPILNLTATPSSSRVTIIRVSRAAILICVLISGVVTAQTVTPPQGTGAFLAQLLFGTTVADFVARMMAIVLYGSSVISAGIHRAFPDPLDTPRWVLFAGGAIDAMSVNGKGTRAENVTTQNAQMAHAAVAQELKMARAVITASEAPK